MALFICIEAGPLHQVEPPVSALLGICIGGEWEHWLPWALGW